MKIAAALLFLTTTLFAAGSPDKEVLATVDAWKQAMLKGDAAALDKLYHPDLAYTHSSALVENKAEAIAHAIRPADMTKAIDIHQLTVHIYGNTAIVKGKMDMTSTGAPTKLDVLMVWLKTGQGWQLVARQAVKLP